MKNSATGNAYKSWPQYEPEPDVGLSTAIFGTRKLDALQPGLIQRDQAGLPTETTDTEDSESESLILDTADNRATTEPFAIPRCVGTRRSHREILSG